MSQPLISIIVPIYNIAPYLSHCLDSILSQSYTTWELLLIDDGSRDNSGAICDDCAQRDERIKVFHIDNQGVSNARNVGIKHSHGSWITFVDGDDWVADDYLAGLLAPILKESDVDFVQAGIQNFKEGEDFSIRNKFDNYIGNDPVFLFNSFRGISGSKLFKKEIIDRYKLKQDINLSVGEDWVFTLDYILHVNKYCFIDRTDYYYRYNSSSITHSTKKVDIDKAINGFWHRYNSFCHYIEQHQIKDKDLCFRWKEMSNEFCQDILAHPFYLMTWKRQRELYKLAKIENLGKLIANQPKLKKCIALRMLYMPRVIGTVIEKMQPRLRAAELWTLILMMISFFVSLFYQKEKGLWLFCERGTDARDNGLWLFRYVKQNHPEINAKYIISKDSEDRQNLEQWNDSLIDSESFTHYLLMWQAKYCCSTHDCRCFPYYINQIRLLSRVVRFLHPKLKIIWLQHGITKDYMAHYVYDKMIIDMWVSGAKPEYEYLIEKYGCPKNVLKYTGLARFDGLHDFQVKRKQILLMPTWRMWLNQDNFLDSHYFNAYSSLLSNKGLHEMLKANDMQLIFYPHYEVQPFVEQFKKLDVGDNIIIADKEKYDVQSLLKESVLLITDYSSVFFDFAYMQKPIIFYQFDELEFHKKQYAEGYFDFHNEFADWADNENDLLELLKDALNNDFEMTKAQTEKSSKYFILRDNHNCERIYNAIKEL